MNLTCYYNAKPIVEAVAYTIFFILGCVALHDLKSGRDKDGRNHKED